METKYPYYYSAYWHKYLKEYNFFHNSHLEVFETWKNQDFIMIFSLFRKKETNQLQFRTGDLLVNSPYWLHHTKIIKKKNLENWLQKMNQFYQEHIEIQDQSLIIHQFPGDTYHQQIPFLELLDYSQSKLKLEKTIVRHRAWVELDRYTFPEIKSHLRKSYKSLANKFFKECSDQVVIYNQELLIKENQKNNQYKQNLADRFEASHYIQAEKKTKTKEGWMSLIDMIVNGEAFLIEYQENFLYFLVHPDYSLYGISASNKDLQVGLMVKAIEYLKKNNYHLLDLGQTYLNPNYQPFFPSEIDNKTKAYDVGFFKSGFATRLTLDYYYQMKYNQL